MIQKVIINVDGQLTHIDAIEFENRAWVVPIWLAEIGGLKMRPLRLIAPRWAAGFEPMPGIGILDLLQSLDLPRSLLEQGAVPAHLEKLVEVVENPDVEFEVPDQA